MVSEDKKQLEVAVRMDSLDEGLPLRYEHSVYVYDARGLQLAFLGYVAVQGPRHCSGIDPPSNLGPGLGLRLGLYRLESGLRLKLLWLD